MLLGGMLWKANRQVLCPAFMVEHHVQRDQARGQSNQQSTGKALLLAQEVDEIKPLGAVGSEPSPSPTSPGRADASTTAAPGPIAAPIPAWRGPSSGAAPALRPWGCAPPSGSLLAYVPLCVGGRVLGLPGLPGLCDPLHRPPSGSGHCEGTAWAAAAVDPQHSRKICKSGQQKGCKALIS